MLDVPFRSAKQLATDLRKRKIGCLELLDLYLARNGERVMTRFTATGTHLGTFRGRPPTGRRVTVEEMAVFRVAGGRIVETWGLMDRLGLFQQLDLDAWRNGTLAVGIGRRLPGRVGYRVYAVL